MITTYEFINQYCASNELPPPTPKIIAYLGRIISHHFKNFWINDQPDEILNDCRLVRQLEADGNTYIVTLYPDEFKEAMAFKCMLYFRYQNKLKEIKEPEKKRTRKPIVKPAFSGKHLIK